MTALEESLVDVLVAHFRPKVERLVNGAWIPVPVLYRVRAYLPGDKPIALETEYNPISLAPIGTLRYSDTKHPEFVYNAQDVEPGNTFIGQKGISFTCD
jgi:hypothetical protein